MSAVRQTSKVWEVLECEMWIGDARASADAWRKARSRKRKPGDKIEVGSRGVNCFTADITVTVAVWRRPIARQSSNRQSKIENPDVELQELQRSTL